MSLTWNQVTAITREVYNDSSADNVYDITPTLAHIKERGNVVEEGGDFIKLPIDYAEVGARAAFKDYDLLPINPNDTGTAARYEWKRRMASIVVSRHELLKNSGKFAVINLLKNKMRNAKNGLEKDLATDLFSTNDDTSDSFSGLRAIVKASGTIGNIAPADFSGWVSSVDSSTTDITYSAILNRWLAVAAHGEEPDFIVTTAAQFAEYVVLLQNQQRFGEAEVGKAGFKYVMFNMTPMYFDPFCPTGHLFLLNSKWLYMYLHSDDNFKLVDVERPATQDIKIQQLFVTGNFCTDNRRMHSAMTALT